MSHVVLKNFKSADVHGNANHHHLLCVDHKTNRKINLSQQKDNEIKLHRDQNPTNFYFFDRKEPNYFSDRLLQNNR
jgi:hypothetical protein